MKINRIQITDFRNIKSLDLQFCETANVIYGNNGQGKTNLMEAVWLFTGAKSFRGAWDRQMIRLDQPKAMMQLDFFGGDREQSATIEIETKRTATVNEIPLKTVSDLAGHFCAVVFSPTHLSLIKNGPKEKRKFMDISICQMKPKYIHIMNQYAHVLDQRNRLLKDLKYESGLFDTLDIWDTHLCSLAAIIIKTRASFLERLIPYAKKVYEGLSGNSEQLDFSYLSTLSCPLDGSINEIQTVLLQELKSHRTEDIKNRITGYGPHRDDIDITLDGQNARIFGSQGQQRSCVLALKLAECELIRETIGEYPVVLLDDVMSELDAERRDYLLNHLQNRQLIMTCCDKAYFKTLGKGMGIKISEGEIISSRRY